MKMEQTECSDLYKIQMLKIFLQLDAILLNTVYRCVVTDSKSKHEERRGKRHRKVYTYIVLLYGK